VHVYVNEISSFRPRRRSRVPRRQHLVDRPVLAVSVMRNVSVRELTTPTARYTRNER
jgi:hypothetical protein